MIVDRRTRAEMPADHEEIEQALEEGIRVESRPSRLRSRAPQDRCRASGASRPSSCRKRAAHACSRSPSTAASSSSRRTRSSRPSASRSNVAGRAAREVDALGTVEVDPVTMQTALPGVFAAGDAVSGPATVVQAIGGGKRAAQAIDRFLQRLSAAHTAPIPVRHDLRPPLPVTAAEKQDAVRPKLPTLDPQVRRGSFERVELMFSEDEARREASGACAATSAGAAGSAWTPAVRSSGNRPCTSVDMGADTGGKTDFRATAGRCIGCGACAANCTNGAMRGAWTRTAAHPVAVRDRAEPPRTGALRALRRRDRPDALPGAHSKANRLGCGGHCDQATVRRLRPDRGST